MITEDWGYVKKATYQCLKCDTINTKEYNPPILWNAFNEECISGLFVCPKCNVRCEPIPHFVEVEQQTTKPVSVLEAKRIHSGEVTVLGTIVSISELYKVEMSYQGSLNYRNAKTIQMEDMEKPEENERLDVVLYDDLTFDVRAGEVVQVCGIITIESKAKGKKKVNFLHASSIKYLHRRDFEITEKNIKAFQKFATFPNLIDRLISMFAPNVIGYDNVKLGLLRSIVGGVDHGRQGVGRVHTLLVGDPGTAKSTLAREAADIKPNSRHISAPHASSKTITAIVDKENDTIVLRLGAIPLSGDAICSIDEIPAFPLEDQGRLLDILQEPYFDVDKHGRHFTIPAPTTIIATANPHSIKVERFPSNFK